MTDETKPPVIVPNWQEKLYKDISTYLIAAGVFLPELINLVLENWADFSSMLGMSDLNDGYKSGIRMFFLVVAFFSKFYNQYGKTASSPVVEKDEAEQEK